MLEKVDDPVRVAISILFFPTFFQEKFIKWAWGAGDEQIIMFLKRIFLLLPAAGIVFCCWVTIACLLTVIVRHKRREYLGTLFVTWWDLGRAIFSFWGGFFKLIFHLFGWALASVRIAVFGLWISLQDIILSPLRALKGVSEIASKPGTPWIAVTLTMLWCALEAFIFTFVMTNMVVDTLSNLTGSDLDVSSVQFVLYFLLLGFIVGSYAIVATLEEAFRSKNIKQILLIFIVEILALAVEVFYLYREFVEALIPWFAQYAGEDFEINPILMISIAAMVWGGIRGMTWFLFAQAGTPTIMAIVQRTGLRDTSGKMLSFQKKDHFNFIRAAIEHIKKDVDWYHNKGDEVLSAFILPPLQIVAACVNFCTLLISAKHLFHLPFKSYKDMLHADQLIRRIKDDE